MAPVFPCNLYPSSQDAFVVHLLQLKGTGPLSPNQFDSAAGTANLFHVHCQQFEEHLEILCAESSCETQGRDLPREALPGQELAGPVLCAQGFAGPGDTVCFHFKFHDRFKGETGRKTSQKILEKLRAGGVPGGIHGHGLVRPDEFGNDVGHCGEVGHGDTFKINSRFKIQNSKEQ